MDTEQVITVIALVTALVVTLLAHYRSGKPLTVAGVTETLQQAQPLAAELREVAEAGVLAAEQLKDTGKIDTNEAAFQHAFQHVQKWFPGLDPKVIADTVEGVYYGVKVAKQSRVNWNS